MNNLILQYPKIIKVEKALARSGLGFLLEDSPFRFASIFLPLYKGAATLPPDKALSAFMSGTADSIFKLFVCELGWKHSAPEVIFSSSPNSAMLYKQREELRRIFQYWVKADSSYQGAYRSFVQRSDILLDKRLYASEIEAVYDAAKHLPHVLHSEIDWSLCDKENLAETFPSETDFVVIPDSKGQLNLAKLWGELFFQKSILVSNWQDIAQQKDNVMFHHFSLMHKITARLKNYAVRFLLYHEAPRNYAQYRLTQALAHLAQTCPQIKLNQVYSAELSQHYEEHSAPDITADYRAAMQQTEYGQILPSPLELPSATEVSYLLKPKNYSRDKRFANSSLVVVWGLALLIYLLLKYF